MPNLMRIAPTVTAAAFLALAVSGAAVPAVASAAVAAHRAPAALPAPSARPAGLGCSSNPDIGWNQGGASTVNAGGYIECPLPASNIPRTVDAALYRNGVEVAYNRSDCYGFSTICTVNTPSVRNPAGYQTWCAVSHATYDSVYNVTKRVCGQG